VQLQKDFEEKSATLKQITKDVEAIGCKLDADKLECRE
jgi:hypothetical protein